MSFQMKNVEKKNFMKVEVCLILHLDVSMPVAAGAVSLFFCRELKYVSGNW